MAALLYLGRWTVLLSQRIAKHYFFKFFKLRILLKAKCTSLWDIQNRKVKGKLSVTRASVLVLFRSCMVPVHLLSHGGEDMSYIIGIYFPKA